MSYNDEKPSRETDVPETTIGGLFSVDFKRHDDLKSMLDSSKDNLKLDAMKRIISLMATGKDMSELFPPVVKNVASKNVELKKLVYVYLVRYAEEQQDLALLSISTFQRALKDPNQLIRGSALRVLSSIRVPVIAPILMLSIKEGVVDMSPYVRKTAAHAIPKLYSLDPEHKDCLIEVLEKLLKDKTTLVAGSAVMAFEEICPDRIELIHKNYRKLCNLLIDIDEWGQVTVIHMLTRYARTQFVNPNKEDKGVAGEQPFYEKSDSSSDGEKNDKEEKKNVYIMDPDHRLLLRTCKPMLQSRNASVVMAVARLYHHCAPASEVTIVARALVRLLRSHREVQSIVLSNIATMSSARKGLFEPYLKSFFVHANDPTHIRLLKLEILTNIAGETSIGTILREFQSYISSSDKQFVASTIQAIGRCASNIGEVTETCLAGLVRLLSNRDEVVVAESVVVIKKLLQLKPKGISDIIEHMAKLLDSITVPMARASILWLLGEYAEKVPKIAPDVLRKAAKSFSTEEDIVKLQILSLGAKLSITNPKQTKTLCQYVLNLAKYDQNYDVRDRARFLRQLILPGETAGHLHKHIKKIFLASKPPPVIESVFKDRQGFQLGSLSHMINAKASDYQELPDFPEQAPDSTVRNVEVEPVWQSIKKNKRKLNKKKSFYSDSESESESESESGSDSDSDSESGSGSESGSEEYSDSESKSGSEESGSDSDEENQPKKIASESEEDTDRSETVSETESDNTSGSESEEELPKPKPQKPAPSKPTKTKKETKTKESPKSNTMDQLLIFEDLNDSSTTPAMDSNNSLLSPTLAADIKSLSIGNDVKSPAISTMTNSFSQAKSHELLHRMTGNGLSATYRFTRSPCIYSTTMIAVELTFTNTSEAPISNIHIGDKKLGLGLKLQEFQEIGTLDRGASVSVSIGIDFNDTTQPAKFTISTQTRQFPVTIKAPVGELLQSCPMAPKEFLTTQSKLRGMNESSSTFDLPSDQCSRKQICSRVTEAACVTPIDLNEEKTFGFSGKTVSSGTPVLVTVKVGDGGKGSSVTVNCEKMVISSMLGKEIKTSLLQ